MLGLSKLLLLKTRSGLSSLELADHFVRNRTERLPKARPKSFFLPSQPIAFRVAEDAICEEAEENMRRGTLKHSPNPYPQKRMFVNQYFAIGQPME